MKLSSWLRASGAMGLISTAVMLGSSPPAWAGGVDRDPITVQRHFDPTVGAEARVRLPCDVREEARGEAEPAH